jgi:hypothetical protein
VPEQFRRFKRRCGLQGDSSTAQIVIPDKLCEARRDPEPIAAPLSNDEESSGCLMGSGSRLASRKAWPE